MIFYLTFGEQPSGIFNSQVIDVVKFIESNLNKKIKLVSFISARGFFSNRKKIKQQFHKAIVLPMFPKLSNWDKNKITLRFISKIHKPKTIIARSVIATQLALEIKKSDKKINIVYDGRGAIEAEWREYKVVVDPKLLNQIHDLEKKAIVDSDNRIAVSNALVEFWRNEFGYSTLKHSVIPCTLNETFCLNELTEKKIAQARTMLGLNANDKVFIYSGSIAGWQSFDLLTDFMEPILTKNVTYKLVFLSKENDEIAKLISKYPQQIFCKHVDPNEVINYLVAADYGLLIRESSTTNKVASPVKYAEYLACGLKVIISNDLGDYSEMTIKNNWGYVFNAFDPNEKSISFSQKQLIASQAKVIFSKNNYLAEYRKLIE